jgi:hypothetical protein
MVYGPTVSDTRVDPLLTNILLAETNDSFVAEKILPTVGNLKDETGDIGSVGNAHLRQYASKRSVDDLGQHRITFEVSQDDSYRIDHYDLAIYLSDRKQSQAQKPFDLRVIAQRTNMDALRLEREIGLAAIMTDTAILTNQSTPANLYTDTVNSTPEVDFDTARDSVFSKTGKEANVVLMSRDVMNVLRRHPWFVAISSADQNGGAGKKALSPSAFVETLKAWYELDEVVIGRARKITSNEGQTEVKAAVWGDDVVFFHRPAAASLMAPSFGYSFQLAGKNLASKVRREPLEDKGDLLEVEWAYQDKVLNVDAAYLLKTVI